MIVFSGALRLALSFSEHINKQCKAYSNILIFSLLPYLTQFVVISQFGGYFVTLD